MAGDLEDENAAPRRVVNGMDRFIEDTMNVMMEQLNEQVNQVTRMQARVQARIIRRESNGMFVVGRVYVMVEAIPYNPPVVRPLRLQEEAP